MKWNDHSKLDGTHATFGGSQYYWLNYTENKLRDVYYNLKAKERGTELHEFAATCIKLKQRLPKSQKTLNQYVNDAIGFRMDPEILLFYSFNFYGSADAISFNKNLLRIHDLKTGTTKASMKQLYIYDALFCLEYDIRPGDIEIENRIYQNDEVFIDNPDVHIIAPIIDKIITFDKILEEIEERG